MPLPLPTVSPHLMPSLRRYLPSLLTVQQRTWSPPSPSGARTETWSDVDGHVDLPCRAAPSGTGSGGTAGGEVRTEDGTYQIDALTVVVDGYHPTLVEEHRAIIDGRAYDIVNVAADGDGTYTRLLVRDVDNAGGS